MITLALIWCAPLVAQTAQKQLPDVTSTEGREFFVAWLPNGGSGPTSTDLKLQLIASSRNPNTVVVEYANGSIDTHPIAGGGSQLIDIDVAKVYWDPNNSEEEKELNKGVRVYSQTDEKFTLYSINQLGAGGVYSFDGAHILPVEALGTEYMVQTADGDRTATELVVMSTKPGRTNVTIELKVNSRSSGQQHITFSLNGPKKIYIVRSQPHDPEDLSAQIDLSGSTICADQPVAVWSGNQDGLVPFRDLTPDHAYDQLLPVDKWGKKFIVPMTAPNTQMNVMRIVALENNTAVTLKRNGANIASLTLNSGDTHSQTMTQAVGNTSPEKVSVYVDADKPVQVYLYSSSSGANMWYDDSGILHLSGDASMTLIPPLEFVTDTTIFTTFNGGDGTMEHKINIWAPVQQITNVRLDGNTIPVGNWKIIPNNTSYAQSTYTISAGTHVITAPKKCFSGYAYGISEGQAYMYPIGYDYTPKKDSLFLLDNGPTYDVHQWHGYDWKDNYLSATEGGWFLDRILQDDGKYLLDSIFVCDSTTLTFPIKTYNSWSKVRWEIEGSIQKKGYFTPFEQASDTTERPELEHQFLLLPIEENDEPFEDFELRAIIIHAPVFCDIPEDKWKRDTLNTTVRVLRMYNDTTWKAICVGDTLPFFLDSLYNQDHLDQYKPAQKEKTSFIATDASTGYAGEWKYNISPGAHCFTRHYVSVNGCDSLSTLKVFVCSPTFEHRDTVVCEDGLKDLGEAQYGDFFKRYWRPNPPKWPKADTVLYDTLRAVGCMESEEYQEFKKHCKSFNGCDSVLELHLTVKTVIENKDIVYRCMSQGNIFEWREKVSDRLIHTFNSDTMTLDSTYNFTDTIQYVNCKNCPEGGCDSVRNVLILTFVSDGGQKHDIHVCQGKDSTYTNLKASYTFNSAGKLCNTPYPYKLRVSVEEGGQELCWFYDSLTFYVDTVYKNEMTYDTLCWDPDAETPQTYTWEGHPDIDVITITGPGTIRKTDVLQTQCNCDSICKLVLYVGKPYVTPTDTSMSVEDTIRWQDTLFIGKQFSGTLPTGIKYKYVTTAVYTSQRMMESQLGCDSLLTLYLKIGETFRDTVYDATCANCGTYNWVITSPITGEDTTIYITDLPEPYEERYYYDSLNTTLGFDSIFVLRLTAYPNYNYTEKDTVCQGETYLWDGHMNNAHGIAHHLYIDGEEIDDIPTSKHGTIYVTDSMHTDTIFTNPKTGAVKTMNCDSVHVLTLVISPTYNSRYVELTDTIQVNSNDTVSHFTKPNTLFVGYDFDMAAHGTTRTALEQSYDSVIYMPDVTEYLDSVVNKSQYGCDSTHYVLIEICRISKTIQKDTVGDNNTTWKIGGDTTSHDGIRQHTLPLVTADTFHIYSDGTPVDYSQATGREVRVFQFIDTLRNSNGCDSIVHYTLRVLPSYRFPEDTTICSNQDFDWWRADEHSDPAEKSKFQNLNLTASGLVYDSLKSSVGADSLFVLDLTIISSFKKEMTITQCYNDTLNFHKQKIYYDGGEDTEIVTLTYIKDKPVYGQVGCDSIYILNMNYCPAYGYAGSEDANKMLDSAVCCQHEPFHWIDKATGKEHKDKLCDKFGNHYTHVPTENEDIAENPDEHGWWITIYDSLVTVGCGCDSTHTLKLYIWKAFTRRDTITMCAGDTADWVVPDEELGIDRVIGTYIANELGSGNHYDSIKGIDRNGCDSSYYLYIHVDTIYEIHLDTTVCFGDGHFEWEGDSGIIVYDDTIAASHFMTEKMDFYDTLHTKTVISGCDSTIFLHLTVGPSADSVWTDTICIGETYTIYDHTYTEPGKYTFHQPNQWGCDITYKLTLESYDPTQIAVTPEPICMNEAGADLTYTLRYTYQGEFQPVMYSVRYDSIAQEAGFMDQDSIEIDEILVAGQEYELYIPTPTLENREDYPRPDFYNAKIAFENGVCLGDSLMTYEIQLTMNYPNWLMEQRHGDVIALLNEQYNGGYTWTEYQWYEGDEKLIGQTKPYLHIPTGLTPGARYHVELTRANDSISFSTCEIVAIANPIHDDFAPTKGYLSVTPTCVVTGHPIIYILSRNDGTYRISSLEGQLIGEGVFHADVTEVAIPAVTGMYVVQLWSNDTPEEPYRAIKVLVREQCPNCDTSF